MCFSPGWCISVDWVACEPMGHWFDSKSGHMPGLQARSPVGGAQEASTHWCFSPFLSPSNPLSLKLIDKIWKKEKKTPKKNKRAPRESRKKSSAAVKAPRSVSSRECVIVISHTGLHGTVSTGWCQEEFFKNLFFYQGTFISILRSRSPSNR